MTPDKLLRVHIGRGDRYGGKQLYEAIVDRCRELQIAGATVICGVEGYGELARIDKQPLVVLIVDSAENIARLTPVLETMIHTGVIVQSDVKVIRVESRSGPSASPPASES